MKDEKKNIDRLFQEKFRDFEASPSKEVWEKIEKELKEEKNKTIFFPFWLRAVGVAALFVGITLIGSLWNITQQENVVSSTERNNKEIKNEIENPGFITDETEKENTKKKQNADLKPEEEIEIAISSEENFEEKTTASKEEKNQIISDKTYFSKNIEDFLKEEKPENQGDYYLDFKRFLTKNNKNSIEEKIDFSLDEDNFQEKEEQSLLEEIAKSTEKEETKEKIQNRMAITPNVAPVYYNSLSGGSAVDPILSDNKSSGEVTMAYGIGFSYAVNEKIKVRTGISKINMSYNTADVAFTSSAQGKSLKGVENNIQAQNIKVLKNQQNIAKPEEFLTQNETPFTQGKLNQQLEYLEIPVEIEYALLEKRFGINIVGGASTLLLSDDAVRINSDMGSTELGRAENVNGVSFTTNIGLGFDYKLTEMFILNLEPSFKYQINGFSGKTAGFRPYYLGVYSGVSFKF